MKKTIYLRLVGGLGNQLYQFSYALQVKNQIGDCKIYIDPFGMGNYNENWGLLIDKILEIKERDDMVIVERSLAINRLRLPRITSGFLTNIFNFATVLSDENSEEYRDRALNNFILIDGYFERSPLKLAGVKNIKTLLKSSLISEKYKERFVINIRGGEYARLGISKKTDREFYFNTIKSVEDKYGIQHWLIVSDDPDYSKKMLENIGIKYEIMDKNPINNFSAVLSARVKILSRSTFSKWAGVLSESGCECYYIEPF